MTDKNRYPVLKVVWEDSSMLGGWFKDDDEFLPVNAVSVGWLIFENNTMLILVQSLTDPANQIGNVLTIPKRCIIERTEIAP